MTKKAEKRRIELLREIINELEDLILGEPASSPLAEDIADKISMQLEEEGFEI